MALRDIVSKLGNYGIKPVREGSWMAKCPAHDDRQASLSVSRGTGGNALVFCHAGCDPEAVVSAIGMTLADLFPEERDSPAHEKDPTGASWPVTATYLYEDQDGEPLYRIHRKTSPDSGNKTFRQQRYVNGDWVSNMDGVESVPYRLPRLIEAESSEPVFYVEGERDADSLTTLGLVATTVNGGAKNMKGVASAVQYLRGRDVVILPDNDKPGEDYAAGVSKALAGIATSVKILRLPGLPPKGDVTDWVGTGGTAEKLRSILATADAAPRFLPSTTWLQGERDERLAMAKHVLPFGVKFLDDAMGGFSRRDLVLLGAKSGQGKTQLAMNIAMQNLRNGKRVHYFMLEGEQRELERRMKYRILASAYYAYLEERYERPRGPRIRFSDWYNGRLDDVLSHFEPRAEAELSKLIKNLHTYYRVGSFTKDDFSRQLASIREHTDLVILDHFHYIDEDNDKDGENKAHKKIVKQIRDSALEAERPVIAIVHLRKTQGGKYATIVPTGDDYHGSSDIFKVATKAIMLAKDRETDTGDSMMTSTFMQIVKCRQDGSLCRYVGRLSYNARTDSYSDAYAVGQLSYDGTAFEHLSDANFPDWARARQ